MFIPLLIYICLFIEILSDSIYSLNLTKAKQNINVNNTKEIKPKITSRFGDFFYFELKPIDENNLFNITFHKDENNFNNISVRYLNQKEPLIYIDTEITTSNRQYMTISCSSQCNYILYYKIEANPILYDNSNFSLYNTNKTKNILIYYKPNITNLNSYNILINVMGKSIEDFPITFIYGNEIKSEKNFINGKGLLITKDSGITLDSSKNFSIKYTPIKNDLVTISSRLIKLDENVPITEIDLLSQTYVVLNKNFTKECFSVKSDSKEKVYLNAFSKQGVYVYHVKSSNYNEKIEEKKIINSDYFLFDLNASNVICFNLIDENISSTTVDFQIFLQDKIMDNNDILTPILHGVEYKFFLKNSTMVYHRLASLNKDTNYDNKTSDFYVKLKLLKGKINFFKGNCIDFPNCTINKETLNSSSSYYYPLSEISNTIEDGNDVGDAKFSLSLYYYSIIYFSKYQILPAVKCSDEKNNEGCEYIIQIVNNIDDFRYGKVSYGKNIHKNYDYINGNYSSVCYAFNVDDENITSIKIELNSMAGNSDLKSYSDSALTNSIGNYYSLGNKEYIIINKNETQENLINQYFYCINHITQTHCISKIILKSDNNSKDYISEGETEINSINFKEKSKKFFVVKQNISNPYYIFIKALNCKLNISYNDNEVFSSKSAQFLDYETSEESELEIVLDSLDSERNNTNENCIFYTGVSDTTKPIEINEGISYDLKLSSSLKKMMFKYDFYLNKTKLLLFIDKYNSGTLKITVHLANSKEYYLTDFNNFKAIDINLKEITEGNSLNHGAIFIDIEYYEEIETDINYSLEILYSEDQAPYYLPTGELILDIMELYGKQYFYTDIKNGQYAEIVINSKTHPITTLYGKIIKKNETDTSSNWNNYVQLPTNNTLTYDYYNRKFIINEKDTKDCDVNYGCELYIGLKNDQSGSFLDYSIFLRYDDTIVKVPNDEYLFGSLEINKEEKQYDYYSYTVTKNIKNFNIIFDTELCEMYINEGNEKPSNDPSKHKYKISSDVHSFKISSESSLINKVYTIAVTPKDLDQYYKSFYRFKIVEQTNEQIIYFIESQSEEFCEIENDGGNCFYILKYNPENKIYNFYARNLLYMETNNINIKAKIVNAKDFELNNDKLSYFNEDNFVYNNALNGYLYFTIDLNSFDEDQFILIKLTSEHKGKISLISQFYPNLNTDYLNPHYYKIFYIDNITSRFNQTIKFLGNETYSFRFQLLNSSLFNLFQANTNSTIELNDEEQNNIALVDRIIGNSYNQNIFEITSKNSSNYTIIGKYTQKTLDINFDTIEFGNPNYFTYYSSYNNIFPIIFYIPVVVSKKDVTIYINITNNISSIDDFNIDVYGILTDSVSVMKAKRNLDLEFNIGGKAECEFVQKENYAVFNFNAKDIDKFKVDDQKYFYIKLNASNVVYNLPNISLVVDTELHDNNYSSSSNEDDSNDKINISTKSYFKSTLKKNETNTFLIKFLENETSKMKLEIYFPTNEFSISFRASNNSELSSSIENFEEVDLNEKIIFIISELSNYNGLVVQLSPKTNNNNRNFRKIDENNSDLFIVKYKEYKENETIIYNQYYFENNSISNYSNDNNYIWSVEQLKSKNSNNNYDIKYILNLYDSETYSSFSILELIGFGIPIQNFSNFTLNDSSNKVIFNISKNDISNKVSNYNITIIANVTYNNADYELLSAKPISFKLNLNNNGINNKDESSDDNNEKNKNIGIIVCLIILFVTIITVIIIIFYKYNLKKTNSTGDHEKFHNEGNDHNNLHTEQQYININEKPDIKNIEMKGVEHPVDILE